MSHDTQLEDLLDRWEESQENGEAVDLNELCHDCPELLEPLKSKIAAIRKMDNCLNAHQAPVVARPSVRTAGPKSVRVDAELVDLRFHDRGGLGVVFKAHDHELHRDVALKLLQRKIALSEYEQRRFHQEAEITGRLDHPGVVPVYAMGRTAEGQPFYVMRFIRGDTFDDLIKNFHSTKAQLSETERRVALRKLLSQMVSVCRTIGYAHTRGIVHRDIKPKNIMCGKYGETLVVDWGLAIPFTREGRFRVADEKTLVPKSSSERGVVREGEGTPVYMSPEQASGRNDIGPASDIHCLGGVLYKTLTGKLAFDGDSPVEIKTRIMKGDFARPRQLDRSIPPALEAVCLKSMALLPSDRYETATAMADDIERFLADAPVDSYRYTFAERLTRIIRRNQFLFATLLLVSLLLAAASMAAATIFFQIQRQTNRSLVAARQSQAESLNMACRSTAKTIQSDLEARLLALEHLAADLAGLNFGEAVADRNKCLQLQKTIENHRDAVRRRLPSESWFLLSPGGQLICEAADDGATTETAGYAFWGRPYFHGGEFNISIDHDRPPPLTVPTLSPVFVGSRDNRSLCSLSVPVVADDDKENGVLVMTIRMGQFEPLIERETELTSPESRFASLVETRGDLRGVLLHHPGLAKGADQGAGRFHVSNGILDKFEAIGCLETRPQPITGYADPIGDRFSGQWNTVAVPIQIRAADGESVACGWFLMVQDRPFEMREINR